MNGWIHTVLWSIAYTRLSATVNGARVVPDAAHWSFGCVDGIGWDWRYSIGWMDAVLVSRHSRS